MNRETYRTGVVQIRDQELQHVAFAVLTVPRREFLLALDDADQTVPARLRTLRYIQDKLGVGVGQTGHILGAFQIARHPVQAFGDTREHAVHRSSIHVSLLPPPCDEFTTSDPLRIATRVSPPGVTQESAPCRINGRRSRWRGWIS